MPSAKYFLSLGGSFLLGLFVVIVGIVVAWLLLPILMPIFQALIPFVVGIALVVVIVIVVIIAVYILTMLGVFIQYLFKPMQISKKEKGYNVAKIKESGLRESGETMPPPKPKPKHLPKPKKNKKQVKK